MTGKPALWIIGLLGVILALNGLYMLIDPILWFDTTPGVQRTGAPNVHFIRDIGLIYLQAGAMMLIGLQMAQLRFVLTLSAGVWLLGHAVFHFVEASCGIISWTQFLIDIPGVIVPGVAVPLLAFAVRSRNLEMA